MSRFRFTAHALEEMQHRIISQEQIEPVLSAPEEVLLGRNQRKIYQSRKEVVKSAIYCRFSWISKSHLPLS